MKLAKIKYLPLRTVFKNETSDFTKWLSLKDNLKLLGNEIGLNLEFLKREASAGKYRVDILATDINSSSNVIIENQLTNTDYSHLGQLITYSSYYNADYIIWVVNDLRIEHEKAIEWLNMNIHKQINFFVVKIELLKIDNSLPAVNFVVLSKPYGWTNKLFRPEIELEKLPNTIEADLYKKIPIKSFIKFLDLNIVIEKRYPKRNTKSGEIGLLDKYSKMYPEDASHFINHPRNFRKYLEMWAEYKGYIINKNYQNKKKLKGHHRSNGSDYYTFSIK